MNGLNIGVRHILPLYALAAVIAGAGVAALARVSRRWQWVLRGADCGPCCRALSVYPDSLAYANEAWGGARNTHNVLNDSNVDWGRQLYSGKGLGGQTSERGVLVCLYGASVHSSGNLWSPLPRPAQWAWRGGKEPVPPVIHGAGSAQRR